MNEELLVVVLLGMVGTAYLLTHFVVEWIQKRFLLITGVEYILLGVLLGPAVVPEINVLADLQGLSPIIAFAAGWVGFLYGMELDLKSIMSVPDRSGRVAIFDTVVTGGVVGWVSYQVLVNGWVVADITHEEAIISAWVLGAAAAAGSSGAVDLIRRRFKALETELLPLLRRSARMSDVAAIVAFGVLECVYHIGTGDLMASPSDWVLITVGLGLGLGFLFTVFLGDTTDENHRFLALVGILIFASGAAFFLKISALLVNLLLGAAIVNSRHGKGVYEVLERTQAPVRLVLLVFAGALWTPPPLLAGLAIAVGYIVLRTLSKSLSGFLATVGTPLRSDVYRGMMAQGDVAVAIAIGFRLVYEGPAVDLAYTAILAAVVVHELAAPRLLKGLLVDAGELRSDVGTVVPPPPRAEAG